MSQKAIALADRLEQSLIRGPNSWQTPMLQPSEARLIVQALRELADHEQTSRCLEKAQDALTRVMRAADPETRAHRIALEANGLIDTMLAEPTLENEIPPELRDGYHATDMPGVST